MFAAVVASASVADADAAPVFITAAPGPLLFPENGNGNKKRPFSVIVRVFFIFTYRFRY